MDKISFVSVVDPKAHLSSDVARVPTSFNLTSLLHKDLQNGDTEITLSLLSHWTYIHFLINSLVLAKTYPFFLVYFNMLTSVCLLAELGEHLHPVFHPRIHCYSDL